MKYRWVYRETNEELKDQISKELGISPVLANLLVNRGISTPSAASHFIKPYLKDLHDPFSMKDMEKSVTRIIKALKEDERIMIYGDYDADGITTSALFINFFKCLEKEVDFYIPNRFREGYGLNADAINKIHERGTDLIITGDCGINACEEVELANRLGMDIIITDHHEPVPPCPDAYAILNPKQEDCPYPFKDLAGVGVAFKLIIALRSELRKDEYSIKDLPNLKEYLDIVSIGTISDMSPLIDENHNMTKYGLKELTKSSNIGIEALKEVSGINGKDIGISDVGFILAPRINSAGRLGDASVGVELFTTHDRTRALEISAMLDRTNRERQLIQETIFREAREIIESNTSSIEDENVTVLSSPKWHQGVIGIVASRLAEEYYRPTILISIEGESAKGSARSIRSFNIYEALFECRDLLSNFGGHEFAAGIALETKDISRFIQRFQEVVDKRIKKEDLSPSMTIDARIDFKELTADLIGNIENMGPFGLANPEPLFSAHGIEILGKPKLIGAKENHLKMKLKQGSHVFDSIGFNMVDKIEEIKNCLIDVAFIPEINRWNGSSSIRLRLKDIKITQYN